MKLREKISQRYIDFFKDINQKYNSAYQEIEYKTSQINELSKDEVANEIVKIMLEQNTTDDRR